MEVVFEKIFFISTEFSKMQEFLTFTQNVHNLTKCETEDCETDNFLKVMNEKIFNEELFFDKRRIFFTDHALNHIKVFNAMLNLHTKGKDNLDKIDNLIKHSNEALERQTFYFDQLRKLTFEKYLI